ncbi:MAG: DUF1513 domain-containing protein [Methylibium sp.]|uniref:DUF1513 domain-containing protein n=1 Tax=Methylibium sp. TaxID=2067992 RepID=UPI0017C48831|nr:DUF1513 domain-containing protein [Methylibium sp.]MBA3598292.1 DUF1513 domain-containing protein [Methylibium sp.]
MPTLNRRDCLAALAALTALAAPALVRGAAARCTLAAAWDDEAGHHIGLLAESAGALRVVASTDVPTRAHGLLWENGGTLLAVARRPGDWLMRWHPTRRTVQRAWAEPDRSFNGHVLASRDGRTLYTPQTDLDTGAGLIGVRDANSLEQFDEWPSHGLDPHALLFDAQGRLLVANGGIPTQSETGRAKRGLDRMDASLVRLDATANGRLLGQWRLDDARLSLRHLARQGRHVGIALQAEHDDEQRRAAAPVLALFDGSALRLTEPAQPLAGYGGDIAAWRDGFAVACPRAGGIALWRAGGRWAGFIALASGCALASGAGGVWAGGAGQALALKGPPRSVALPAMRLDNHWVALSDEI